MKRAARKRLRSKYFFNRILRALEKSGLVGEAQTALVLYVVATSSVFDRPLNLFVKGHSAAGKNWLTTLVLDLFPEDFVLEVTSASEQAWSYFGSELRHFHRLPTGTK